MTNPRTRFSFVARRVAWHALGLLLSPLLVWLAWPLGGIKLASACMAVTLAAVSFAYEAWKALRDWREDMA